MAEDIVFWDEADLAAVGGLVAVVAEDEIVVGGDGEVVEIVCFFVGEDLDLVVFVV